MKTEMQPKRWSFTEVARVAGRSVSSVTGLAHAGLLPEPMLTGPTGWVGADLSPEVAEALVAVLTARTVTPRTAALMKEDPARVLAAGEALVALARLVLAEQEPEAAA